MDPTAKKRKNILLLITDEERYPPPYETEELRHFRESQLKSRKWLKEHGVEFHQHHIASAACVPSRTSLFTGQYPSLHRVTQTNGITKDEEETNWLEPHKVPTMGNYFEAAGYDTVYRGKWHLSNADLLAENHSVIETVDCRGESLPAEVAAYQKADVLKEYGFHGWIGPEPHGPRYRGSGWVSDPNYAQQVVEWLEQREKQKEQDLKEGKEHKPFLLVASLVNPHDIVFFPILWRLMFGLPPTDETVPDIPASPTDNESLLENGKPPVQHDYIQAYNSYFTKQRNPAAYRKFYYFLHKVVDRQMGVILDKLKSSSFFEDTIIVWTADHGDLLGSHGGMYQKWHNAYQETIHVPLIIANLREGESHQKVVTGAVNNIITSHIDLLPTILGLAGIDHRSPTLLQQLMSSHSEFTSLVGYDWSVAFLNHVTHSQPNQKGITKTSSNITTSTDNSSSSGSGSNNKLLSQSFFKEEGRVVYFMTEDEIFRGSNTTVFRGRFFPFLNWFFNMEGLVVREPPHVESIVVLLPTGKGSQESELWKLTHYYTNPELRPSSTPELTKEYFEVYNLTQDPIEVKNLMGSGQHQEVISCLQEILAIQRSTKRLAPQGKASPPYSFHPPRKSKAHYVGRVLLLILILLYFLW